mmetsp:Transcript_11465/g.23238  ORF Transcript_11465/g.23238 Transcript_11465/m.23238 type:complete len:181 (-) Transcript_11465:552-1094(-)
MVSSASTAMVAGSRPLLALLCATLAAAAAGTDACKEGMTAAVRSFAPQCLDACPQVCPSLGEALQLYLENGDYESVVCANAAAFSCITGSARRDICSPLFQQAASMGLEVPQTTLALMNKCGVQRHHDLLSPGNGTDANVTMDTTTTAVTTVAPPTSRGLLQAAVSLRVSVVVLLVFGLC